MSMTKEGARTLSQVFLVLSILTILFICGNCCANSQRGSYGPEEFYDKGGGKVGYGAKYYSASDDNSMPVAGFGGILFIAFSIASMVFSEKAERLPSETESAKDSTAPPPLAYDEHDGGGNIGLLSACPVCSREVSLMAATCPGCGHPLK